MATMEKGLPDSITEFSLDLYKELASSEKGNLFMSPSSVSIVMAMVRAGARSDTKTQITNTLKLDKLAESKIHPAFKELITALRTGSNDYTLSAANKLYPHTNTTILASYISTVQNNFLTEIEHLDYSANPEPSRAKINNWVEAETMGKIRDLLASGMITQATVLVVVNAIYFKGDWAEKFEEKDTTTQSFYVTQEEEIQVNMMYKQFKKLKYGQIDEIDCSVISLPYKGEKLSMLVLLPEKKEGLSFLEKEISAYHLVNMESSMYSTTVNVFLPKFKLESEFQLNDTLSKLGMPDVFDSGKADLSGMSGMDLYVSHVVHKAYVEVNEKGTEAAAATGAGIMLTSLPMTRNFVADRPFLIVIWDQRAGIPLFIGRVMFPRPFPTDDDGDDMGQPPQQQQEPFYHYHLPQNHNLYQRQQQQQQQQHRHNHHKHNYQEQQQQRRF